MKDDQLYIVHMLECAERVLEYTQAGRDDFLRMLRLEIDEIVLETIALLEHESSGLGFSFGELTEDILLELLPSREVTLHSWRLKALYSAEV